MNSADAVKRLATSRRILVLGSSGSGKTHLTGRLAHILGIEPIHLDAWFWKPGWVRTPRHQWRQVVESLVSRDSWIMDGMYESTLDVRLPAAEVLIVLERSRWICLGRAAKRRLTMDDRYRTDAPPGQKLDWAFVRYIWRYRSVTRPVLLEGIERYAPDKPLIVLRGGKEVEALVTAVQHVVHRHQPSAAGEDARRNAAST